MTVEHNVITDPEIHEPKGASTASNRDSYVGNGSGSGVWLQPTRLGWWNYDDTVTSGTPIVLTLASTDVELTNNGAGPVNNITFGLPEQTNIWNTSTNRYDFSGLSIGDVLDVRLDVIFTTGTNNTAITLESEFQLSPGTPFKLPHLNNFEIRAAGTSQHTITTSFFLGSSSIIDNPGRIVASADKTGTTVVVNGWFIRAWRQQENG